MSLIIDKLKQFLQNKQLGIEFDTGLAVDDQGNVTPTVGDQPGKMDFIELRILEAQLVHEKDISQMPLEKSKIVNDNSRLKPKKVHMKVIISDYRSAVVSISRFFETGEVRDKLDLFQMLHEESIICKVITMTREYKNMQLVHYDFSKNPQNRGKYLIVDMDWEEMMFFEKVKRQDRKRISLVDDNGAGVKNNKNIIAKSSTNSVSQNASSLNYSPIPINFVPPF